MECVGHHLLTLAHLKHLQYFSVVSIIRNINNILLFINYIHTSLSAICSFISFIVVFFLANILIRCWSSNTTTASLPKSYNSKYYYNIKEYCLHNLLSSHCSTWVVPANHVISRWCNSHMIYSRWLRIDSDSYNCCCGKTGSL